MFSKIFESMRKPDLFEPGETHFWDDPHISKGMLEAHLDPNHDAASRKPDTIERTVRNLISSGVVKKGDRILDLGCGPGLYTSRFAEKGMAVTGIDLSPRSIDYAQRYAKDKGLEIDYRCMNFFDIDYKGKFDVVMQVYGELNTFSDEKRDELLDKVHQSLKMDGNFIFDVSTRSQIPQRVKNYWYISDGGFWHPGKHLVLEKGFDYPEYDTWLDQNIILDEKGNISVYRNWFHDYSLQSIRTVLEKAGFSITHIWNDLTGSDFREGGDWIALVVKKLNKK